MRHKETPSIKFDNGLLAKESNVIPTAATVIALATLLAALYAINKTDEERPSPTGSAIRTSETNDPAFYPIQNTNPQEFGIVYGEPQPGDIIYSIRCDSTPPGEGQTTTHWRFDISSYEQSLPQGGPTPVNSGHYIIFTQDGEHFFCIPPKKKDTPETFQILAGDEPT